MSGDVDDCDYDDAAAADYDAAADDDDDDDENNDDVDDDVTLPLDLGVANCSLLMLCL